MSRANRVGIAITLVAGVCLAFPRRAEAYIDPGTGSFVLQLLVGGALGTLLTVKLYWKRLKTYLRDRFSKGSDEEGDADE